MFSALFRWLHITIGKAFFLRKVNFRLPLTVTDNSVNSIMIVMGKFFRRFQESTEWGPRGHKLVASAAQDLLSEKVSETVNELLAPLGDKRLVDIATWADIIKNSIPKDKDSQEFIEAFSDRGRNWHFVDLPQGCDGYDRTKYQKFTRKNDIVQSINLSIKVLQGTDQTMSSLNALRWITHLVGDIHQPLHVSCGYIDQSKEPPHLVDDPSYIEENDLKSDHGGNSIILSSASQKELNLHSFWDGMLGFKDIDNDDFANTALTKEEKEVVDNLVGIIKSESTSSLHNENEDIPVLDRAKNWASESLLLAREAYQSIVITETIGSNKFRVEWEGKDNYIARCAPIVEKQIQLASKRLAALLEQIFK
jgi:hypothetical protein